MMRFFSVLIVCVCVLGAACAQTPTVPATSSPSGSSSSSSSDDPVGATRAQLTSLATLAVGYETEHGRCLGAITDVVTPAPVDPWGQPIAFMPPSPENPRAAFVSSGPDQTLLTDDDVAVPVSCSSR
jgi:hypothetical protein